MGDPVWLAEVLGLQLFDGAVGLQLGDGLVDGGRELRVVLCHDDGVFLAVATDFTISASVYASSIFSTTALFVMTALAWPDCMAAKQSVLLPKPCTVAFGKFSAA